MRDRLPAKNALHNIAIYCQSPCITLQTTWLDFPRIQTAKRLLDVFPCEINVRDNLKCCFEVGDSFSDFAKSPIDATTANVGFGVTRVDSHSRCHPEQAAPLLPADHCDHTALVSGFDQADGLGQTKSEPATHQDRLQRHGNKQQK
ncbi:MAG: hypothetical protein JXQ99_02585 [Hyphomicrobiaceae bacterium]